MPFDFGTSGTFSDIEVVISAFGATRGPCHGRRAAPVRDYTVVVFSTFRDRWSALSRWVKTGRSSADWNLHGHRVCRPATIGSRRSIAVDDTVEARLDPDLLESLSSRAVRITLGEGQSQDLALRLFADKT